MLFTCRTISQRCGSHAQYTHVGRFHCLDRPHEYLWFGKLAEVSFADLPRFPNGTRLTSHSLIPEEFHQTYHVDESQVITACVLYKKVVTWWANMVIGSQCWIMDRETLAQMVTQP